MSVQEKIVTSPETLLDVLRLQKQFQELGLKVAFWDRAGELSSDFECCKAASDAGDGIIALGDLAAQTLADSKSHHGQCPGGCCAVSVPMLQRRRILGAATVCYPTGPDRWKNADDVERLVRWLIERDMIAQVAKGEISTLSTNLATTYEELSLLYRISGQMKVTATPRDFVQSVCDDLVEVMNIQAAAGIVYIHPPAIKDDAIVLAGSVDLNLDQIAVLLTQLSDRVGEQKEPVVENAYVADVASGLGPKVQNLLACPLTAEGQLIGLLVAINKTSGEFCSSDMKLMHSIANQTSVFLVNHRLYADLQDLLMGVLHALTATIDAKDPYTRGHSQRVALLSRKLAESFGMAPAKCHQLYLSGLLHDIGKIGVPEAVLCKEGRLTPEEYETIKKHPTLGARILEGIRQLDEVIVGILTHHERPDGRGYPRGLSGAGVPIEGLIVGLADVFDAMTSDRTYRRALRLEETLAEIRRCAGAQFDPRLVELLMQFDFPSLMEQLRQCNTFQKDFLTLAAKQEAQA